MSSYTTYTISDADNGLFASNRPVILSNNVLKSPGAVAHWAQGSIDNPVITGPDVLKPFCDGYTSRQGGPDSVDDNWWLVVNFATPQDFDTVVILNHNLAGEHVEAGSVDVSTVYPAFWFGSTLPEGRKAAISLPPSGPRFGFTADNFFLKIENASVIPKIGEIFVGKRTQLPRKASRPYSVDGKINSAATFESSSGAMAKYHFYTGKAEFEQSFTSTTPEEHQKFQEIATGSSFGANQVIWIEDPDKDLSAAHFGFIESGFSWPHISPSEREIDLKFSEQGPHFLSAEA